MCPANKTRTNESNSPSPYYVTRNEPSSSLFRQLPRYRHSRNKTNKGPIVSRYRFCICRPQGYKWESSRRGTRSAAWHDLLFHGSFVRATHAPTLVYFRTPSRVIHVNRARHCLIQFYSDLVIRLPR